MCIVFCQVEASASCWSLEQGVPSECGLSECDGESSIMRKPRPTGGAVIPLKKFSRTLYLREQGYEDLRYFSEPKEVREQKKCGKHWSRIYV